MKKKLNNKNAFLIVLLIVIAAFIFYLNSQRVVIDETDGVIQDKIIAAPSDYINDEKAIKEKSKRFKEAPELRGIEGYLNTDPDIRIQNLKGKVVLIDF